MCSQAAKAIMKRISVILLVVVMAVTACGSGRVEDVPERPRFSLMTAEGEMVEPHATGGCWPYYVEDEVDEICSHIDLNFDPDAVVELPADGLIRVEMRSTVEPDRVSLHLLGAATLDTATTDELGVIEWSPDVPPGEYVLSVEGYWGELQGSVDSTFSVRVMEG
jgi:hypothetical protein